MSRGTGKHEQIQRQAVTEATGSSRAMKAQQRAPDEPGQKRTEHGAAKAAERAEDEVVKTCELGDDARPGVVAAIGKMSCKAASSREITGQQNTCRRTSGSPRHWPWAWLEDRRSGAKVPAFSIPRAKAEINNVQEQDGRAITGHFRARLASGASSTEPPSCATFPSPGE
jgi:hypothetical protein